MVTGARCLLGTTKDRDEGRRLTSISIFSLEWMQFSSPMLSALLQVAHAWECLISFQAGVHSEADWLLLSQSFRRNKQPKTACTKDLLGSGLCNTFR